MEKTVILTDMARSVSELTGCTVEDAEAFLRETFALATRRLAEEGRVTISGTGTFVLNGERVEFAPDAELAAALNAPFAAFEAIELPEGFDAEEESETEEVPAPQQIAEAAEFEEAEDAAPEPEPETEPETGPEPEPESISEPEPEIEAEPQAKSHRYGWMWWLVACVIFFIAGWFAGRMTPVDIQTSTVAVPDTVATKITAVENIDSDSIAEPIDSVISEPPVVTDTIKAGRFLTTMARRHYGQMEYWVYIYEENSSVLRHPDGLSAGTVLTIPPAAKYGLAAGDSVKIREAIVKAHEIYNRFN